MNKTNLDELVEAGVVTMSDCSDSEKSVIESLSKQEIHEIVHAAKKLQQNAKPGSPTLRVVL